MIRPSLLPLAEKCGHAVELAEKYPQGSTASEDGKEWHRLAAMPDFQLPLPIANLTGWNERLAEHRVKLLDLDGGEVITEGTADLLLVGPDSVTVIDYKTGDPSRVPDARNNLQVLAYGLAAAREARKPRFRAGCYFTQGEFLDLGDWIDEADYSALEQRIKKAVSADRSLPIVGQHCDSMCYRRSYCRAFLLPATQEPSQMLAILAEPGDLTQGKARAALHLKGALKAVSDVLDARLRDFARQFGGIEEDGKVWGPVIMPGRRSISLEDVESSDQRLYSALDDAGLIKAGKSFETFRWTKKKEKK